MTPTTIKLPDELKRRIGRLIEGTGQSMHSFLVDAISQRTDVEERRHRFVSGALEAREEMARTGKGFPADKVHAYLQARAAGRKAARPKARAWRK
jgi:predicted transcriptional regulator